MRKPMLRRCVWCTPHHLLNDRGETIPGCASDDREDVVFMDTMCPAAEQNMIREMELADKDVDIASVPL